MRLAKAILLLSILSLNLFGFYISFFISRTQIKAQTSQFLSTARNNMLEKFEFSADEYAKLQRPDGDEEEVIINGALYDIKAIEFICGKYTVFAKIDGAENKLLSAFLYVIDNKDCAGHARNHLPLNLIQQDFTVDDLAQHGFFVCNFVHYLPFTEVLRSYIGDGPVPPPDSLVA